MATNPWKNMFPPHIWQRGVDYYRDAMGRANNRKAYWSVIQTLKKVRKYPDGKVVAKGLADCWRAKYPRRTSMLDELSKAGF